jgi:hypothetical protein
MSKKNRNPVWREIRGAKVLRSPTRLGHRYFECKYCFERNRPTVCEFCGKKVMA